VVGQKAEVGLILVTNIPPKQTPPQKDAPIPEPAEIRKFHSASITVPSKSISRKSIKSFYWVNFNLCIG